MMLTKLSRPAVVGVVLLCLCGPGLISIEAGEVPGPGNVLLNGDKILALHRGCNKLKEAQVRALLGPGQIVVSPGSRGASLQMRWKLSTRIEVVFEDDKVTKAYGVFSDRLKVDSRVTESNLRKVRLGMTKEAVSEILGKDFSGEGVGVPTPTGRIRVWGGTQQIDVWFDDKGLMTDCQWKWPGTGEWLGTGRAVPIW